MKNVLAKYSKGLRFQFVFQHKAKWPVKWMCSALQVSMSGFYRWQSRNGLSQAMKPVPLVLRGSIYFTSWPGCLRTNADNQAKIADTTTTISENTAIQANETNTPKNKKAKIKDPLKVKRADKLKKKPNMNG